jgi:hypothetical protein
MNDEHNDDSNDDNDNDDRTSNNIIELTNINPLHS